MDFEESMLFDTEGVEVSTQIYNEVESAEINTEVDSVVVIDTETNFESDFELETETEMETEEKIDYTKQLYELLLSREADPETEQGEVLVQTLEESESVEYSELTFYAVLFLCMMILFFRFGVKE